MLEDKCNRDLERFLKDYSTLCGWENRNDIRLSPRDKYKSRLTGEFDISEYLSMLKPKIIRNEKIKILFAHFSPFEYEMEALGFPSFVSKMFPNSQVDFTYDKGGRQPHCFEIKDGLAHKKDKLENKYDLMVARSSVLQNMRSRPETRSRIADFIVNIKTMSLHSNTLLADHCFEEEEMCPPSDPTYLKSVDRFLSKNAKENLIVVSGTLWYVKNQLKMFEQLDANIINEYKVVIMGPVRDPSYVTEIIKVCESKNIDYYLIGQVSKELARDIKSLSKISLIPMDMRTFGQPKGYPRTLGESIGSRCITLCNSPVTVPDYYKNSCLVYDESVEGDFNSKLAECVSLVSNSDYINTYDFGSYTMEELCTTSMIKIMELKKSL